MIQNKKRTTFTKYVPPLPHSEANSRNKPPNEKPPLVPPPNGNPPPPKPAVEPPAVDVGFPAPPPKENRPVPAEAVDPKVKPPVDEAGVPKRLPEGFGFAILTPVDNH